MVEMPRPHKEILKDIADALDAIKEAMTCLEIASRPDLRLTSIQTIYGDEAIRYWKFDARLIEFLRPHLAQAVTKMAVELAEEIKVKRALLLKLCCELYDPQPTQKASRPLTAAELVAGSIRATDLAVKPNAD